MEEKKTFSKSNIHFITKEEDKNLKIGTYLHYLLENIDFKNPNIESYNLDKFYQQKLNIYKEYEFIDIDDNIKKHGIIDLMIEYDDYIDIIDYKFHNIDDEHYVEQLKGYRKFIERKTNKKVNTYLYSIMDEKLKEII